MLEILKKSEQILNILNMDWKFWTDSKHSEHELKILNILNIDWKFWTDYEHWLNRVWKVNILNSEQILNILNIVWTESEHF